MSKFTFKPADWVPYKDFDPEMMARLRAMKPEDLLAPNPNSKAKIIITKGVDAYEIADMFTHIKESDDYDRPFIMISGNPCPDTYIPLANLINQFRVNCRNLICFPMDEWADDQGNIAPLDYTAGFGYSFFKYFIMRIDEDLRPKKENIYYHCKEFTPIYSDLIMERSEGKGADACYSGPGWTGHCAFIDPSPEFINVKDMDEYLEQKAGIVTLHPLTIAQNSLHGVFGHAEGRDDWSVRRGTFPSPAGEPRAHDRRELLVVAADGLPSDHARPNHAAGAGLHVPEDRRDDSSQRGDRTAHRVLGNGRLLNGSYRTPTHPCGRPAG